MRTSRVRGSSLTWSFKELFRPFKKTPLRALSPQTASRVRVRNRTENLATRLGPWKSWRGRWEALSGRSKVLLNRLKSLLTYILQGELWHLQPVPPLYGSGSIMWCSPFGVRVGLVGEGTEAVVTDNKKHPQE